MTERIAIVGGGTGGTVLANRLAEDLAVEIDGGDVEVVLLNEGEQHVYKPTFLYIPFGKKTAADATRPLVELVDHRVDLRIREVTGIDPDAKQLSLGNDGGELRYDYLVLASGARLAPEDVPGLREGGHWFYNPAGAAALRDALATFTEGHLVVSVIGVPHMCPAAPLEFVFMADDWFRQRGLREEIDITYTYPIARAHGVQSIADWATPRMEDRDIAIQTFTNPEAVEPEAELLQTMEGSEIEYDLLVTIPPHRGSPLVDEAGLGEDGWAAVDRHTLEVSAGEDVYAIGDVADVPTSKAGSVAHYEAGVVAQRLASQVRGHIPTATYEGKTVCFIEAGMDEATFVEFGYGAQPTVREPSQLIHWAKLAYNQSYWLTARGVL